MVIPEINMCDFEAGMKCLQNPSTISCLFSIPTLWKYGALILAIFATFNSIIKRIKLIFIRFHTVKPCSSQTEDVFEFSDEDDDDDISLASSDDEQEGEEDHPTAVKNRDQHCFEGDFGVRGSILSFKSQRQSGQLRRRGSGGAWSEFACGKNVVKLWDSLGFSVEIDDYLFNYDTNSIVSTWNRHQEEKSSEFRGDIWPVPALFLTAESNGKGDGVILGGYDRRMRSSVAALLAEWKLPAENDVSGVVTVGDVRNVRRPLGDTWWEADAVITSR
ncbi:hypothetical protein SASPL_125629 [Salvia splendens]|uniref:Uncharacterized protein n=1 Tax=Salvia splendens TaxID=180675 RepID=A0A8X8ZQX2_SALSN|nr:uncharacterized protein LOC121749127 [Salvia splendens]KAG6412934.1 hypothetical protein SASPL_125629 [Salvia splendens]